MIQMMKLLKTVQKTGIQCYVFGPANSLHCKYQNLLGEYKTVKLLQKGSSGEATLYLVADDEEKWNMLARNPIPGGERFTRAGNPRKHPRTLLHDSMDIYRLMEEIKGIGSMETHTAASSKGPDSQGVVHGVYGGKAAARAVGATEYAEDTSDDDETNDNATSPHCRAVAKKGGKLKKNAGGSATIDLTDALTSMTGMADTMKEQNERTQQWHCLKLQSMKLGTSSWLTLEPGN
ncbi:TPA: hypothetical protein ACH3X1_016060 [Trebouxia sp. C0004]